jgi:hypothetical protein
MPRHISAALILLCAFIWTSDASAMDCPSGFMHEKEGILYPSPASRLLKNKVAGGRFCLHVLPLFTDQNGSETGCLQGYENERAEIFHDSPRDRILGHQAKDQDRFCLGILKPGTETIGMRTAPINKSYKYEYKDTAMSGQVIGTAPANNTAACQTLCSSYAFCQAYSWSSAKVCTMMNKPDKLSFEAGSNSARTGRHIARTGTNGTYIKSLSTPSLDDQKLYALAIDGGFANPVELKVYPNTADMEQCRARCTDSATQCSGFDYGTDTKKCTLYNAGTYSFQPGVKSKGKQGIRRTKLNPSPGVAKPKTSNGDRA